jgi:Zn-dependent M28 family amino/carboxypeptidase
MSTSLTRLTPGFVPGLCHRLVAATLALCAIAVPVHADGVRDAQAALSQITPEGLLQHIRVLSSDTFEGRFPGTHGEELTLAYLVRQFKELGLEPAAGRGQYLQVVPMTAFRSHPDVHIQVAGADIALRFPEDYVGWTSQRKRHVTIARSPLVFVGYGVRAPEYDWDDFKGMDLRGKTLVMLINDPPVPDPQRPGTLDPATFGGNAMTYYGRWTYKFEIAARLGAAAAIIVHETEPAAYPFSVVINSWGSENIRLRQNRGPAEFPAVAGWMTRERAVELFKRSGVDFDALKALALRRDFRPVELPASATFDVANAWHDFDSHNVIARLPGSDAKRAAEAVVYSAHWDHFGWRTDLTGPKSDQVFHGALDNASGTAGLLALAKAFRARPSAPSRSVVFLATTAEEQGLLGARYYVQHPVVPLKDTVVDINMDGLNPYGRTRDIEIVGYGKSDVDDLATRLAQANGRSAIADLHPERGSFYRADQLEFARGGVPILYTKYGLDFIGQSRGYGDQKVDEYIAKRYHQVGDVIQPDWSLLGGAEDLQLLWKIGAQMADSDTWPRWKPGAEFKAVRDLQRPGD